MHDVWSDTRVEKQLAADGRLLLAFRGQSDVDPAGEQAVGVPCTLAMPKKHQGSHVGQPSRDPGRTRGRQNRI